MITVSGAYSAHLQGEVTQLATCWKVTRKDASILGFTDHTSNLIIGGITYQAALGYTPSDITTSADLAVDNLELSGVLDSTAITEADLMAGVWDHAVVEIFEVVYSDLSAGTRQLRIGRLGEIKAGRTAFTAELRGLSQALTRSIGEIYSPGCRADLGDARCKKVLTAFTFAASVSTLSNNREFTAAALTQAIGYFDSGKLTWTGGLNNGLSMEVKTYTVGSIILQLPMPYQIQVGDGFSIIAGCLKRFTEDCKDKFNNVVNFRGEPHVPGIDKILKVGGS